MANHEHLAILREGVTEWNAWRRLHQGGFRRLDLSHTDLSGTDLRGVNFSHTDLDEVNLSGANLEGAMLYSASLTEADLSGSRLSFVNLEHADLTRAKLVAAHVAGANLRHAKLNGADLRGSVLDEVIFENVELEGANLTHAHLSWCSFGNVRIRNVVGLETLIHLGPSTIGIDTICYSRGNVPESFLRGCGVPENFINFIPSLVDSQVGIQFYSCFISHSFKDEEFVRRLYGRMRDAKLRVWFAPEDIQGGMKMHEQIETAIRVHDKLLIVLSEGSLQSEWVMTELRKARKAERETGKRKLFPVRLVDLATLRDWECFDADTGKDLAVELREYFIPDFSHWKEHDQFEAAFSRLLKDLKTEAPVG